MEDRQHVLCLAAPIPREVEVARRSICVAAPEAEQHGALEHEALAVRGRAEPLEEPFGCVSLQSELNVFATCSYRVA